MPKTKNVAATPRAASTSRIAPVATSVGPSSNVKATTGFRLTGHFGRERPIRLLGRRHNVLQPRAVARSERGCGLVRGERRTEDIVPDLAGGQEVLELLETRHRELSTRAPVAS